MPKIEEHRIIAKSTNATVIGISESKLDESVLELEVQVDDYKILRCDRNRPGGGVACYIRNDLSYNSISVFPREIESVFFEIILPNSKPITGPIYCPPNQSIFLELLIENMNKIDSISKQIYILGDLNINLPLHDSYFKKKKVCQITNRFQATSNFVPFLSLHQLIKVPTRITCNSAIINDHILASYPDRVTQQGIIDAGLSDHQLIFVQEKFLGLKEARTNKLNFTRSSIIRLIVLRKLDLV